MANEEPHYASLPSGMGPPSEEGHLERPQGEPNPFWRGFNQDEYRLQQRRPRELYQMTLDPENGQGSMGWTLTPPQEPPYGSEPFRQDRASQEGLAREAVEEVLAENELLRRRISDLEAYSSVVSTSSRGRQIPSSTGRSLEMRQMEPDYDRLFGPSSIQTPLREERANLREEDVGQDRNGPAKMVRNITQRSGSLERWRALRSFLGFPPPTEAVQEQDQTRGGSDIQVQGPNVRPVLRSDRGYEDPFAGIEEQRLLMGFKGCPRFVTEIRIRALPWDLIPHFRRADGR